LTPVSYKIGLADEKKYREAIGQLELCCQTFEMDPLRSWMLDCLIELARKAEDTELAFHYQQKRIEKNLV
jgi:hypothetical protein